jgi:TonB family protein
MKRFLKTLLLLLLAFSVLSCRDDVLSVKSFGKPEYPTLGVIRGIEGTVQVSVSIEVDGTVSSALGTGADPILVEAAERNARQWVFSPLPRKMTYPANHQIEYVYKFRGHPLFIVTPPTITTDLPDRIEIVSSPFKSGNSPTPVPAPKNEKN